MNAVFIGGSRQISLLPEQAKSWLDDVIEKSCLILVGDANGVDKAVQKYLADAHYDDVTVYCSGEFCRNNVGRWVTRHVDASGEKRKFQFYAAKDREMARQAESAFMVWDGKSPGTVLNVLRLVRASKKAVLFNVQEKQALTFNSETDWDTFLLQCSDTLRRSLKNRALPTEWASSLHAQTDLGLSEPSLDDKRPDINTDLRRDMT